MKTFHIRAFFIMDGCLNENYMPFQSAACACMILLYGKRPYAKLPCAKRLHAKWATSEGPVPMETARRKMDALVLTIIKH